MKQIYITRFHTSYEVNTNTGCWEWQGNKKNGYGSFRVEGKTWYAHRFSSVIYGLDMSGEVMRHKCDNRVCVNPAHLETGSHQDNMDDMWKRGRGYRGPGNAKLTEAQVLAIREEYAANPYWGAQTALAKKYLVEKETIRAIISREHWGHI